MARRGKRAPLERTVRVRVKRQDAADWLADGCRSLGWTVVSTSMMSFAGFRAAEEATASITETLIDALPGNRHMSLQILGVGHMTRPTFRVGRWTATMTDPGMGGAQLDETANRQDAERDGFPRAADLAYLPLWRFLKAAEAERTSSASRLPDQPRPTMTTPEPGLGPVEPLGSRLFVSYRRTDNAYAAGRLRDELAHHFGEDHVFFDVDSIPLGADFRDVIHRFIGGVTCMVVVIGANWQPERLADEGDFVRVELLEAREQGKLIVPVLLDETPPPTSDVLPGELQWLAFANAAHLGSDSRFRGDVERIAAAVRAAHSA